jgi:hypothetical protein
MTSTGDMGRALFCVLIIFFVMMDISRVYAQIDIRSFIPKISGYNGKLTIDMVHREDETKTDGKGENVSDTRMSEKLKLSLGGYVYHPRFMLYRLDLSVGLGETRFRSETEETGWKIRTGHEFEFRTIILPYHPYNLELHAARREPLIMGALSGDTKTVITEKGATFRYKKRPFSLNINYDLLTTETGSQKTDSVRYGIRGSHSTEFISTSIGYNHSNTSGEDIEGKTDTYTFSNSIRFWITELISKIDYSDAKDKDLVDSKHKSLSWKEHLKFKLPWNFEGNVSFDHLRTTFEREAEALQALNITNRTDDLSFGLRHELYKSLRTNLNLDFIKTRSDGGETKTKAGSLLISYTKKIPIGRIFANFSGRNSTTERTGTQFSIRESFPSDVGEGAELVLRQGANEESVSVEVRGCTFDNEFNEKKITAALIRDENYIVNVVDNRVVVEILSLSIPKGGDFIDIFQCSTPEGDLLPLEFLVTYGISGDSEVETISMAYGLRFDLFGGLISPYYNRLELRQKILSGFVPFEPENSTSNTFGLVFNKPPFKLSGEYSKLESEFRPSTSYKAFAEYQQPLTPTFRLKMRTFFTRAEITKTKGTLIGDIVKKEVTEDAYGINVNANKRFSRYLNLNLGAIASKRKGESETTSYSLRGDLLWAIGKINLKTGATITHSENEFKRTVTKRVNQFYYLRIERVLF